ncbi:hypothetical protein [Haloferula sp.]|uniref:hypothetical protein n=1 Tax=Haloferula sp. TaxID=2497595 RepID=UPI003C75F6AE
MKTIINLIFGLILMGVVSCQETRKVKVTVTAEDGTPLKDVTSIVTFMGYTGDDTKREKGETDARGVFQASGEPQLRMYVRLEKKGYYTTVSGRLTRKQDHDVAYVLREIKNPIPLYAKRLQVFAPVVGKEFGYDCEVGDWVQPHGKGRTKDLVLTAIIHHEADRYTNHHYELAVSFSNEKDGFVKFEQNRESELEAPYEAPANANFQSSWRYFKKREPGKGIETNREPDKGYFFRLRTQVDRNGDIISCHYAKAFGDFPDLKIYFNPSPNDRNLEFDPSRNLFTDLDPTEQVREP